MHEQKTSLNTLSQTHYKINIMNTAPLNTETILTLPDGISIDDITYLEPKNAEHAVIYHNDDVVGLVWTFVDDDDEDQDEYVIINDQHIYLKALREKTWHHVPKPVELQESDAVKQIKTFLERMLSVVNDDNMMTSLQELQDFAFTMQQNAVYDDWLDETEEELLEREQHEYHQFDGLIQEEVNNLNNYEYLEYQQQIGKPIDEYGAEEIDDSILPDLP